jgi:hypothetical protein
MFITYFSNYISLTYFSNIKSNNFSKKIPNYFSNFFCREPAGGTVLTCARGRSMRRRGGWVSSVRRQLGGGGAGRCGGVTGVGASTSGGVVVNVGGQRGGGGSGSGALQGVAGGCSDGQRRGRRHGIGGPQRWRR